MLQRREMHCRNHSFLSLAHPWAPCWITYLSLLSFPPSMLPQYSHDGATLGLVLAEGGGEQLCLAGQMEESLGEAADRTGFIGRLGFVHAGQSRSTENTVDALLGCEGWALQVSLCSKLLGQGWTLQCEGKIYVELGEIKTKGDFYDYPVWTGDRNLNRCTEKEKSSHGKPVHGRWESVSDWTAPCACIRLCAGLSCSLLVGSVCWDRSPGSLLSTARRRETGIKRLSLESVISKQYNM